MTPAVAANAVLEPKERAAPDEVLQRLMQEPFRLAEPAVRSAPFLFASPHSGRLYPPSFLRASRLDPLVLRRSEDAFVDEFFAAVPQHGAAFLTAQFPRAYLDVNRSEAELDSAMFESGHGTPAGTRTARVAAGLGVIPRVVRDGVEIYRGLLPVAEAAFRLNSFYRPYHEAVQREVGRIQGLFGVAVVIDCHSMPPVARGYDVVVGDRHGTAAAPELSGFVERSLRALGFSVGRNTPYAGGHTTSLYGRPSTGLHAVQIEVNRGLYLDEKRMEKTAGFAECLALLSEFSAGLIRQTGPWRPERVEALAPA
jgi:N-formylglutamate amidohydrolase